MRSLCFEKIDLSKTRNKWLSAFMMNAPVPNLLNSESIPAARTVCVVCHQFARRLNDFKMGGYVCDFSLPRHPLLSRPSQCTAQQNTVERPISREICQIRRQACQHVDKTRINYGALHARSMACLRTTWLSLTCSKHVIIGRLNAGSV